MSNITTISNSPSSVLQNLSISPPPLLQSSAKPLISQNSQEDDNRKQILQSIRCKDEKSKYPIILKNEFSDSNFKNKQAKSSNGSSSTKIQKSYVLTLRALERKTHPVSNIIALLKTEFPIVHNIVHNYFNYKFYTKEDLYNDINLLWVDTYVSEELVKRLKPFQKINHFPSSCEIGRKNLLTLNLNQAKKIMKQQYKFYPNTWVLPKQLDSFCQNGPKDTFLIVKPYSNCQGRGIFLTKNPVFAMKDEIIVQQYMHNPMLIDQCKFDLRIYVLLRSLDPLRIYVYREGLCRLATEKYIKPNQNNFRNEKMHLTNYAVNKFAPNFIPNKDLKNENKGHKRSYTSVIKYLSKMGFNTQKIEERIQSIIVRTILACYTKLHLSYKKTRENNTLNFQINQFKKLQQNFSHQNTNNSNNQQPSVCFQLLGFDIMLLDTGEPILLEVNHQPSLVTDSPLDMAIKKCLIMDTINILNINEKDKEEWLKCQKQGIKYKINQIEQKQLQNMGGFKSIYPLYHTQDHDAKKSEMQRVKNIQMFYQTIMNKFLFNQFKQFRKNKISTYRTISSRIRNSQNLKNTVICKQIQHISMHSSDKSRVNITTSSPQKQQPIAVTFYNLFNDTKYQIKSGASFFCCDVKDYTQLEDLLLVNHIGKIDNQPSKISKNPQQDKKQIKKQNEDHNFQKKIKLQKKQLNLKFIELQTQQKSQNKSDNHKNEVIAQTSMSYQKFRDHLKSFRNKGINPYISSRRPKAPLRKNQEVSRKSSQLNFDKEQNEILAKMQKPEFLNLTNKQVSQNQLILSNKMSKSECNEEKQIMKEYKEIYVNSIRERTQKISNLKLRKNKFQNLNFTFFLKKHKIKGSEPKIRKDELSLEFKQTATSVE